ncbi:sterol-binding protein, partial [Alcaligenes pakistanensis]
MFCTGLNVLMRPHLPADIAERLEGRALRIQVADAGLAFDYTWRQGAF